MAAGMPLKTTFADGTVLPAGDLNDITNTLQDSGTYPNQLAILGSDAVRRPLPFAMQQNSVNITITAAVVASATVTWAASTRFTQAPFVFTTLQNAPSGSSTLVSRAVGSTTTGVSIYIYTGSATNTTSSAIVAYMGVQMLSATTAG